MNSLFDMRHSASI